MGVCVCGGGAAVAGPATARATLNAAPRPPPHPLPPFHIVRQRRVAHHFPRPQVGRDAELPGEPGRQRHQLPHAHRVPRVGRGGEHAQEAGGGGEGREVGGGGVGGPRAQCGGRAVCHRGAGGSCEMRRAACDGAGSARPAAECAGARPAAVPTPGRARAPAARDPARPMLTVAIVYFSLQGRLVTLANVIAEGAKSVGRDGARGVGWARGDAYDDPGWRTHALAAADAAREARRAPNAGAGRDPGHPPRPRRSPAPASPSTASRPPSWTTPPLRTACWTPPWRRGPRSRRPTS